MGEERTTPVPLSSTRLAALYEAHVPRGVAIARLLTGDEHVAEDLAHDAFIKAAGRFAHLRRPEAFDAYYRRAVVNTCKMQFRRSRVERRGLEAIRLGHDQVSQAATPRSDTRCGTGS